MAYYRRACEGGDGGACAVMGVQQEDRGDPDGGDPNYFLRGCELGDSFACRVLAGRLRRLRARDDRQGVELAWHVERLERRACSLGSVDACFALLGPAQERPDRAGAARLVGHLRASCEDHEERCDELAEIYLQGRVVAQDIPAVARYRARSCTARLGFDPSCSRLDRWGEFELAPRRAARSLRDACKAGEAESCRYLGFLLLRGEGMPADPALAATLFQRACGSGDRFSCSFLGNLFERGIFGEGERVHAVSLYRQGGDDFECGSRRYCSPDVEYCWGSRFPDDAVVDETCGSKSIFRDAVATIYGDGRGLAGFEVVEQLRVSCSDGDPFACRCLGDLHSEIGMAALLRNVPQPEDLYRQACEAGSVNGCFSLFSTLAAKFSNPASQGHGGAAGSTELEDLYETLCERGILNLCRAQAGRLEESRPAEAIRLHRLACEGGDIESCRALYDGWKYEELWDPPAQDDDRFILGLVSDLCDRGEEWFCGELGAFHEEGGLVPHDVTAAARLYERACRVHRDGRPCYRLGLLYAQGAGVDQDLRRAARLIRHACVGGVLVACGELLRMPRSDRNLEGDMEFDATTAVRVLEASCDRGSAYSCGRLGDAYRQGLCVDRDPGLAASFYDMGCADGEAWSCRQLAVMYSAGRGVERNLDTAGRLITKAAVLSLPGWLRRPLSRLEYVESAVDEGHLMAEPASDQAPSDGP